MLSVQDLIDQLLKVEDKSIPVHINVEYGYGCSMVVTDVECEESNSYNPETDEYYPIFVLSGYEDEDKDLE